MSLKDEWQSWCAINVTTPERGFLRMDPGIPEFTGATKDARALRALSRTPWKESRTCGSWTRRPRRPQRSTHLRAATPDDTVVIYFAGHGTPGHQRRGAGGVAACRRFDGLLRMVG